jgi:hypothetical protein
MVKVWEKAIDTVDIEGDAGDILAPLKRVGMQYAMRAAELEAVRKPECAAYYHEQAQNIDALINQ